MDAMEEDQPFELEVLRRTGSVVLFSLHRQKNGRCIACLQAYANNYTGHAKVERLLFIAEKQQGTAFGDDALRLALEELSQVAILHTAT